MASKKTCNTLQHRLTNPPSICYNATVGYSGIPRASSSTRLHPSRLPATTSSGVRRCTSVRHLCHKLSAPSFSRPSFPTVVTPAFIPRAPLRLQLHPRSSNRCSCCPPPRSSVLARTLPRPSTFVRALPRPSTFVRALPCPSVVVRVRPCSSVFVRVRPCSSVLVRLRPCPSVFVRVRPLSSPHPHLALAISSYLVAVTPRSTNHYTVTPCDALASF